MRRNRCYVLFLICSQWHLEHHHGKVAIKSHHGGYIGVDKHGHVRIHHERGHDELFEELAVD